MVFRKIIEDFSRSKINPFWIPSVIDTAAIIDEEASLDISNKLYKLITTNSGFAASFLRSMFPICGEYKILLKFRVDDAFTDARIFTTQKDDSVPIAGTSDSQIKLDVWWDTSEPEIEIEYFNTSDVRTNLDVNNAATVDTWYWLEIHKTLTKYNITVYNEDFTILTGRSSVNLSSVREGTQPDYLVIGVSIRSESMNLDLDKIVLIYDPNANYYSDGMLQTNARIWGKGL